MITHKIFLIQLFNPKKKKEKDILSKLVDSMIILFHYLDLKANLFFWRDLNLSLLTDKNVYYLFN